MTMKLRLLVCLILFSLWSVIVCGRQKRQSDVKRNQAIASAPSQATGCGVSSIKSRFKRVVGGVSTEQKKWPWMAAIMTVKEKILICGGTLISDRHVLTAAQCLLGNRSVEILVRLGKHILKSQDNETLTDYRVGDIRVHQKYDLTSKENDIAILKLEFPSTLSELIWPVCLPPPDNDDLEGLFGYVVGWGNKAFAGSIAENLQEVKIPVWKQTDCVSAYTNIRGAVISDSMMCIGLQEGRKDACNGDSGGPFLIQLFPSTKWYVAGIISGGLGCATPGFPGIYTRVNKYLDWIETNAVF